MLTVSDISKRTGISVRTLHYYDSIGLLTPAGYTESGYRVYEEKEMKRLYNILLLRQLKFSLKDIKRILDNPEYDIREALTMQIEMLEMQKKQIEKMIILAGEIRDKGETDMGFDVFNNKFDQYKEEVIKRWGDTEEYNEYISRSGNNSEKAGEGLMFMLAQIGKDKEKDSGSKEIQNNIKELQNYITENFYTCSDEILGSLGEMYVGDERMKENIDRAGGEGTAEFVREAIRKYCAEKTE